MERTKTNDVDALMRLSLSTFLHLGLMAQYEHQYILGMESQKEIPIQANARELVQNRDKMIFHACFAGLGAFALIVSGIAGLASGE